MKHRPTGSTTIQHGENISASTDSRRSRLSIFPALLMCAAMLSIFAGAARADQALGNIAVGSVPSSVGVNPVTNRTYVAQRNGNVSVIDGTSGSVIATVAVGTTPFGVAVNTETNRIYVANQDSNTVTVINGADNSTNTIAVGTAPYSVAINPVTNRIYVAGANSTITIINGADNSTQTITINPLTGLGLVAVNPVTNTIYVSGRFDSNNARNVIILNGANNSVQTITLVSALMATAVNPITNKFYGIDMNGIMTVIDGNNNNQSRTFSITGAANGIPSIAINTTTNRIYIPNGDNTVSVINSVDDTVQSIALPAGSGNLTATAVNTLTDKVYIADSNNGIIRVIKGLTASPFGYLTGGQVYSIAVNPVSNRIYTGNASVNSVTVIDGGNLQSQQPNGVQSVAVGTNPVAAAVNSITNRVYVANRDSNNVSVINPANNNSIQTVAVGTNPVAVAVNPILNRIYVANQTSNNLVVIFGNNNVTTSVNVGTAPVAVAVNPVTSRVYVVNQNSNNVTVVDGANNSVVTTVAVGTTPFAVAVNPETNRIYVANQISNNITVINGADNSTSTVNIGTEPLEIAVNPVTNRIYVAGLGGVNVINGVNNSIITTVPGMYLSVAVNPVTNRIYGGQDNGRVNVINGADNTAANFLSNGLVIKVAVNPATNKIYASSFNLTQVDGAVSRNSLFVTTNNPPRDIVFNQQTDQVFVPIPDGNTVTVLTPNANVAAPLNTTVAPSGFTNNTTTSRTPTFNLTANSTNTLAPRNIYYQFDTKQGEWLRASTTGSTATTLTATATAPFLRNGIHTIYFFAADATSSTSINPSRVEFGEDKSDEKIFDSDEFAAQAGSITGQIGSYQFLVAAPLAPTAAAVTISGRIMATNRGVASAVVWTTNGDGNVVSTRTNAFGYYLIADLPSGATYVLQVRSKRYEFAPQIISLTEDLVNFNFYAINSRPGLKF